MALMDKLRAKVNTKKEFSGKETNKQLQALLVANIILSILYIPMVIVGSQNNGTCEMNAPLYLMIAGGIGLGMTLVKIYVILKLWDRNDKIVKGLIPLATIIIIGVTIWGSILVFGSYSSWSYDKTSLNKKLFALGWENESESVRHYYETRLRENLNNKEEDKHLYCAYTLFMMAFVLLILHWVIMPLFLFCESFLICLSYRTTKSPDSAKLYSRYTDTCKPIYTATSTSDA